MANQIWVLYARFGLSNDWIMAWLPPCGTQESADTMAQLYSGASRTYRAVAYQRVEPGESAELLREKDKEQG